MAHGRQVHAPVLARHVRQAEIRVKTETCRHRDIAGGSKRGFDRQARGVHGCGHGEPARIGEDHEAFRVRPVEARGEPVRRALDDAPNKMRPHHAVHGEPVVVVAQNGRVRAQGHAAPGDLILEARQAIGPGKEEGDACRPILLGKDLQLFVAPQILDAFVPQRDAEHAVLRQEHGLRLAGGDACRGGVVEWVGHVHPTTVP